MHGGYFVSSLKVWKRFRGSFEPTQRGTLVFYSQDKHKEFVSRQSRARPTNTSWHRWTRDWNCLTEPHRTQFGQVNCLVYKLDTQLPFTLWILVYSSSIFTYLRYCPFWKGIIIHTFNRAYCMHKLFLTFPTTPEGGVRATLQGKILQNYFFCVGKQSTKLLPHRKNIFPPYRRTALHVHFRFSWGNGQFSW